MRILFASAEVDPFAKVGGLADVASALPHRLREMGHDVRVVTPCHASSHRFTESAKARHSLDVPLPGKSRTVQLAVAQGSGEVPVHLVCEDHYFNREVVYGEPDDLLRYQFFCRAVVQMLMTDDWVPDILHLNDWHTAPLAFALRNLAWSNPKLRGVASIFTIHNLRYRGPDDFNDFLSQAIYYSDAVTTVSPTYAREILTPEFGEGLDALLTLASGRLHGILNGLNFDLFNPRTDPHLSQNFDLSSTADRTANKALLRAELGLPETSGPLLAMVTRLTEQKGVDIVLQSAEEIADHDAQLVVLGDGDATLLTELRRLQTVHPNHIRLAPGFDEPLARRIYAGSDMFLMPSRYEPCGLGQLIAMRYGSVPIGRRTGGIADTVQDLGEHPETSTGFLFDEFSKFAFIGAFERAITAFRNQETWARLQSNGMSRDFSWRASATRYVETYRAALASRGVIVHD